MKYQDWSVICLQNLIDVSKLAIPVPLERGEIKYYKKSPPTWKSTEGQVTGSLSRYNHPDYQETYYEIKKFVEDLLGEKLYTTYNYDRFYFKGQELKKHTDRESCEISVSLHVSSNLSYDWPLWFKLADGDIPFITKPGDAILYKGIELEHWRDPMQGDCNSYYHQIFFHYVRRDGIHVHNAFDKANK